jgi:[ribosomal protein S5]-alanine N-acetyltransferase
MHALPRLQSERLELRPFSAHDALVVEHLAGAREVADTTLTIPHPYPIGSAADWIATHPAAWAEGVCLTLAICARADVRTPLGAISLKISQTHLHGELGYWIGVSHWGQGYATEAARTLTGYAFTALGLHRVQGRHFTRNAASGRVLQKVGMQHEGVQRDFFRRWGRFEDVAAYAMLEAEWNAPVSR